MVSISLALRKNDLSTLERWVRVPSITINNKLLALLVTLAVMYLGVVPPALAVEPLIQGPGNQHSPAVEGNRVFYVSDANGSMDIYYHDIAKGTEHEVDTGAYDAWDPTADGDNVVYVHDEFGVDNIRLINVKTGVSRDITNVLLSDLRIPEESYIRFSDPVISGSKITYQGPRSDSWEGAVWLFDLEAGDYEELAQGAEQNWSDGPASVGGNIVAWSHCTLAFSLDDVDICRLSATGLSGKGELYSKDEPFSTFVSQPSISDGKLAWWEGGRIFVFDDVTGKKKLVSSTSRARPDIAENKVAWSLELSEENSDIVIHDLATGVQKLVTSHPSKQTNPSVGDSILVWADYRNDATQGADIYYSNIDDLLATDRISIWPRWSKAPYGYWSKLAGTVKDKNGNLKGNQKVYLAYMDSSSGAWKWLKTITTNSKGYYQHWFYYGGGKRTYRAEIASSKVLSNPTSPSFSRNITVWNNYRPKVKYCQWTKVHGIYGGPSGILADVTLYLQRWNGSKWVWQATAKTDKTGYYAAWAPVCGTTTFRMGTAGSAVVSPAVVKRGSSIAAWQNSRIHAMIKDGYNSPITGMKLYLQKWNGSWWTWQATCTTSSSGYCNFGSKNPTGWTRVATGGSRVVSKGF